MAALGEVNAKFTSAFTALETKFDAEHRELRDRFTQLLEEQQRAAELQAQLLQTQQAQQAQTREAQRQACSG